MQISLQILISGVDTRILKNSWQTELYMEELSNNSCILGVAGLPASGKAVFSEVAAKRGFKSVVMGDFIRNECLNRGLQVNRENCDVVMISLRKQHGKQVVAKLSVEKVEQLLQEGQHKIIIDGIRSFDEVQYFKDKFERFEVVAIHASPRQRLFRMRNRDRDDDAKGTSAFITRDQIEMKVGIGNVIALAEYLIDSPDTLEEAKKLYSSFLTYYETLNQ